MKKTYFLLLILVIVLCGCKESANHMEGVKNQNNKEKELLSVVELDVRDMRGLTCLYKDSIIFSEFEEADFTTFYKYDLKKKKLYKLGKVQANHLDAIDVAASGDYIYIYRNNLIYENYNPNDRQLFHSLYMMDIENNTLERLAVDSTDRDFVYLETIDDKIISIKQDWFANKLISYLDVCDITGNINNEKENDAYFDILISKEYDRESESGEAICNFTINNNIIYTLVNRKENGDSFFELETYNLDGSYIKTLSLENENVISVASENIVTTFVCIGDYVYLKNLSTNAVLYNRVTGECELVGELGWDIAVSPESDKRSYGILFNRDNGKIMELSGETNTISEMDFQFETLNSVRIDGTGRMIIKSEGILYKNFE